MAVLGASDNSKSNNVRKKMEGWRVLLPKDTVYKSWVSCNSIQGDRWQVHGRAFSVRLGMVWVHVLLVWHSFEFQGLAWQFESFAFFSMSISGSTQHIEVIDHTRHTNSELYMAYHLYQHCSEHQCHHDVFLQLCEYHSCNLLVCFHGHSSQHSLSILELILSFCGQPNRKKHL